MDTQQQIKEKMNGLTAKADSVFSQKSVQELTESVGEMSDKVRAGAETAMNRSVDFAKKYPLHTALGAIAIGFIAGFFVRSSAKRSDKH